MSSKSKEKINQGWTKVKSQDWEGTNQDKMNRERQKKLKKQDKHFLYMKLRRNAGAENTVLLSTKTWQWPLYRWR